MDYSAYWQAFLRQTGRDPATPWYACDHFGSNPEMSASLLAMVLSGQKRATTSALPSYQRAGEALPQPGDLSLITDWAGNPACVLETTAVTVLPFCQMTFDIARREGEDECLETWVAGHRFFFHQDAEAEGYAFTEDMPVVFEDFRVLFTLPKEPELEFLPLKEEEKRRRLADYAATLPGAVDDFWEEHVLQTRGYALLADGEEAGFLTLFEENKLTAFCLAPKWAGRAEAIFARVLERFSVREAYAVTCDKPFLTLCLDRSVRQEMQAYFFLPGEAPVRDADWGPELFRQAVPGDEARILDTEGVAENISLGKYFILEKDGEFLGQGFFNPMELVDGVACIGMSVHPDHRRQGVGRSILLHLIQLCKERGLTPRAGCWYLNTASHNTLLSAGFVPAERYLHFYF